MFHDSRWFPIVSDIALQFTIRCAKDRPTCVALLPFFASLGPHAPRLPLLAVDARHLRTRNLTPDSNSVPQEPTCLSSALQMRKPQTPPYLYSLPMLAFWCFLVRLPSLPRGLCCTRECAADKVHGKTRLQEQCRYDRNDR